MSGRCRGCAPRPKPRPRPPEVFAKLLIANRGEIACRVMRTARALGVRTVAVYSDADRDSAHVAMADEAVRIGPPPAAESYLLGERLLDAARASGAEAIHPGYGFLSERVAFAQGCADAGICFVGPPPAAIAEMGDKAASLRTMHDAGVPVLPGYRDAEQSDEALLAAAERVGYPLMVKPSAGGGGKGMHAVRDADDLREALAASRREASGAFGDATLLLERLLESPRHIEVQLLADRHGKVLHLLERDCSLQRRHQKVVEEAPGVGITPDLRASLGAAAVRAAEAIGYVGAGTVEFLLDADGQFYFMEMNTRLQVEHPVTEMIVGLDLVEWQLRVAAGEPLPFSQQDIGADGHAIEVRLYAEDPDSGFLPSTGRLAHYAMPDTAGGVRVDTGVREGDSVSPFYDPMLAKLIVHGASRAQAAARMRSCLEAVEVDGLTTNTRYLHAIVSHPDFATGGQDTRWLERVHDDLVARDENTDRLAAILATAWWARRASAGGGDSPFETLWGWRAGHAGREATANYGDDGEWTARWTSTSPHELDVSDGTVDARVGVLEITRRSITAEVDGVRQRAGIHADGLATTAFIRGQTRTLTRTDRDQRRSAADEVGGALVAPMPGTVVSILVEAGDAVQAGDRLLVLEAMKMEHTIRAPSGGVVVRIGAQAGEMVSEGFVLAVVDEAP